MATKFPTFNLKTEDEIKPIFAQQLKNLGVEYIDYYLLHNFQTVYNDGVDGNGGVVKTCHLLDHAVEWKAEGKDSAFRTLRCPGEKSVDESFW